MLCHGSPTPQNVVFLYKDGVPVEAKVGIKVLRSILMLLFISFLMDQHFFMQYLELVVFWRSTLKIMMRMMSELQIKKKVHPSQTQSLLSRYKLMYSFKILLSHEKVFF